MGIAQLQHIDRVAAKSRLGQRQRPAASRRLQGEKVGALGQAGLSRDAVDVLELSDPHGITAVLALEALGYAERGAGTRLAAEIGRAGRLPLAIGGGMKARGDVGGATGVYQIVELVEHLRRSEAQVALAQCLGGSGSTAVTHILSRV